MRSSRMLGGVALVIAACHGNERVPEPLADTAAPVASEALAADLRFLREEEKLARDVYTTLYATWQLTPHQRIASSEQIHMDRVLDTIVSLGLTDPVQDNSVGAFVDPQLGALFTQLVAAGEASEVAALQAGATIEDLDLRDLGDMSRRTTDPAVLAMYATLQCGSRNHLRAFTSQLALRDVAYTPQYIPRDQFDAILAGAQERCGM